MEDVKSVGWNSGYKMPKSKQWFHFAYTYNYASGNKVQQYFINGQPAVSTNSPGYPLFLFPIAFSFSFTKHSQQGIRTNGRLVIGQLAVST